MNVENTDMTPEKTRGAFGARKFAVAGLAAAGILVVGLALGIIQGRAVAGGDGVPAPQTPGTAVETPGVQPAPQTATRDAGQRYARRGCGSGSGCGQSARRGCCSAPAAGAPGAASFEMDPTVPLEQYGAYLGSVYSKKLGGPVEVEVRDFGCHQEAQVTRGGRLLKRLSIGGGVVTEIG